MDEKNAMQLLDESFKFLSAIHVSGDDVDLMAAARQRLRAAYSQLNKKQEVENGG